MLNRILVLLLITASLITAQDFTDIRIYINPGHGGHDSDDRYIAATGFWESDGNLGKGLYLRDILTSFSATTKMSRTTNNTSDDLGLSVIVADANNFDADYFHAIHSNGYQGTSNYTLILFQGGDNSPTYAGAKTMGSYLADEIYKAHRTTTKYNRGDADFYGTGQPYLGVFKGLTMPGTLSEGSFHDYIPESWRLRNDAYLQHEAWAITKAFIKYFELDNLPYGEIAGILRDPFDLVNYFALTSDKKKPLNLVKATLMQENKLYLGDDLNNGFFMFDKVPPGTYDIILEAEDYLADTIYSVTVSASNTTFVDKNLLAAPNYSPPVITSFTPSETENVRLNSDFVFEFNVKMDPISVEQSFSIIPNIPGSFSWELNNKRMTFKPSEFLKGGTTYQILISGFAKSAYNVLIEEAFSNTFSTRSSLTLIKTYPDQNTHNISSTVKIKLKFDAPINEFLLGGNVFFQDEAGENVELNSLDEIDYGNGWIIFEPLDPLKNNSNYQIKLLNGIQDIDGSNLSSDTTIFFRTGPNIISEGTILSDFEEIGNWWQPDQSGSTAGIDPDKTIFAIADAKAIDGSHSGKLNYLFNIDSLGICRIYNQSEPQLNSTSKNFGIWIFGDFSYNILEYWFRDNLGTNTPIFVDTLNWTGWKFKEIDLSSYSNLAFHSIVVSQNKFGEKSGQLYFDAIQTDVIVTGINSENDNMPKEFVLEQNYPNPFNPTTTISYTVPSSVKSEKANVKLIVYDVLGREVKTLVNRTQSSGNYEVTFDASDLPSGIYYYQLNVGEFIETKNMVLLK